MAVSGTGTITHTGERPDRVAGDAMAPRGATGGLHATMRRTGLLLVLAIVLIWSLFYLSASRVMRTSTEETMRHLSNQVIGALETEFLALENMAYALSRSTEVREFVRETDALAYHEKAADVREVVLAFTRTTPLVDHVLVYNSGQVYYRFLGTLGNTAAARVSHLFQESGMPQHRVLQLEGIAYVCYACAIEESQGDLGYLVFLINEEKLKQLFTAYNPLNDFELLLVSNDTVMTATSEHLRQMPVESIIKTSRPLLRREIGFTGFEVIVSSSGKYSGSLIAFFTAAVVATAVLFVFLAGVFLRYWNRHFFRPAVRVMQGIEALGIGEANTLQNVQEDYFDRIVDKINVMIKRLCEKSEALLETQYKLQQIEIEKHKAVIEALKKQIHAHFIVNALNIVKVLAVRQEAEKAVEICDGLSSLVRYAQSPEEWIEGLEEFFILQWYAAIMKTRYPDRFEVVFEGDECMADVYMPRMLVQPLLENAVIHGFSHDTGKGLLLVRAKVAKGLLVLTVSDNGRGMEAERLKALQGAIAAVDASTSENQGLEGIALINIQKRVLAYFGVGYGLDIQSGLCEGTCVSLVLPVRHADGRLLNESKSGEA